MIIIMGISHWNITWRNTPWLQFAMQTHQFKWVYHLYWDYMSNQNNSIIWNFRPVGIIYLSNNHSSVVLETRKYAVNVIELPSWKHFSSFLEVTIFLYVPNLFWLVVSTHATKSSQSGSIIPCSKDNEHLIPESAVIIHIP